MMAALLFGCCDLTSSLGNLSCARACAQLLADLSTYQYTRRAWRKEAFEMLLEPNFFQMDLPCLRSWRVIVDNLMTQDKNTFKEILRECL